MSATGPRMKRLGASGRRGEEDSGVWSIGGFFLKLSWSHEEQISYQEPFLHG